MVAQKVVWVGRQEDCTWGWVLEAAELRGSERGLSVRQRGASAAPRLEQPGPKPAPRLFRTV